MSGEIPAAGVGPLDYEKVIRKMGNLKRISDSVGNASVRNKENTNQIVALIVKIKDTIKILVNNKNAKGANIDQLKSDHSNAIKKLQGQHDAAINNANLSGAELKTLKDAIEAANNNYMENTKTIITELDDISNNESIISNLNDLVTQINALDDLINGDNGSNIQFLDQVRKNTGDDEDGSDDDEGTGGLPAGTGGPPAGTGGPPEKTPGDQGINDESDTGSVSSMSTTGSKNISSPEEIQATMDDFKRRANLNLANKKAAESAATRPKSSRAAAASGQIPGAFKGKGGSRKKRRRSSNKRRHITRRKHHSKKKHGGRKSLKKHKKVHKKKRPIKRVTFKKHH